MTQTHASEVSTGRRFEFGKNWNFFLQHLNDERIAEAEESLRTMLECADLRGKTFVDIGSGSGLFSLAARRLGARVHSFDYDPNSVGCTRELHERYFPGDPDWAVESGSALDSEYLSKLGQFDIVYSWGVLHHTGAMWAALNNVAPMVRPGGRLFISIYNDEGGPSRRWLRIKELYCRYRLMRWPLLALVFCMVYGRSIVGGLLRLRIPDAFRREAQTHTRGMRLWHNLVDWTGGYPFEVAKAEVIFDFYRKKGFELTRLYTDLGHGCNQFVFLNAGRVA